MTQTQRRKYLITALAAENPAYAGMLIPEQEDAQKHLLRALFNLRAPDAAETCFLQIQDAYLQQELREKGVTDLSALTPLCDCIYLWRGDITTLRVDGIVNAANSGMLGCFIPGHSCIDNAIHTYAGVQLRLACARLMRDQGYEEPVGRAKITPAFNLPSRYVLHTVGPLVSGALTNEDARQLAGCYRSCLELAAAHGLHSLAFCCISTGEFHFPPQPAAAIAIDTVRAFLTRRQYPMKVIFNVFKSEDEAIYRALLAADNAVKA